MKLNPELNDVINEFLSEKNLEVKQKLAHLIIMSFPGLNIFIKPYLWRNSFDDQKDIKLTGLSMYSDNWWDDQYLENLVDEAQGENNHPELWLRFVEGLGGSRDDDKNPKFESTKRLVNGFF